MKLHIIKFATIIFLLYNPNIATSEIIFQDNFNNFTKRWTPSGGDGHRYSGGTLENPGRNEPEGWTGYINYNNELSIETEGGVGNSPCLRIGYKVGSSFAGQVGLVKYLGKGYDELYIQYSLKLSSNFHYTPPATTWKHGRVWQNVTRSDIVNNNNLTTEEGKGAIVWGWYENSYGEFAPYMQTLFIENATEGTNDCKNCTKAYYFPWNSSKNGGHLEPHIGTLLKDGGFANPPPWVTITLHYKLATEWNGNDGIYELWINGIKQIHPTRWEGGTQMPTAKIGEGMSLITLMDNGTISSGWTEQHYIYIDNIKISTSYAGPLNPSDLTLRIFDITITD